MKNEIHEDLFFYRSKHEDLALINFEFPAFIEKWSALCLFDNEYK